MFNTIRLVQIIKKHWTHNDLYKYGHKIKRTHTSDNLWRIIKGYFTTEKFIQVYCGGGYTPAQWEILTQMENIKSVY